MLNPYLGDACMRDGAVESLRVAVDSSALGAECRGMAEPLTLASGSQVECFYPSTSFLSGPSNLPCVALRQTGFGAWFLQASKGLNVAVLVSGTG